MVNLNFLTLAQWTSGLDNSLVGVTCLDTMAPSLISTYLMLSDTCTQVSLN